VQTSFFRAILYGWVTVLVLLIVTTVLLALVVRFTNISETTLATISLIIALLSLFIGGLFAGLKGEANGILLGVLTGGGFTFFTFLVQYLGYDAFFTLKQLAFHLAYILSAVIGSIIGVNLVQQKQTT